jgi:uncharacterized protein YndB with AHSA1/START domain
MARIEETVEIKCPADKVFAYVATAKSWPKWHLSMLEAEQTSPGEMGVGTTFGGANKVMGRRKAWTSKVTEYEMNKKWRQIIKSGSTLIDEHLTFYPVDGGTKFTQVYDMKVGGFLKLFAPMLINTMRKEMKTDLNDLKSILETQS